MAVTTSFGYTNGTTGTTTSTKMPLLGWKDNYVELVEENRSSDTTMKKVYNNLTSPTNQPEHITIEVGRRDNIVLPNMKTAYAPSSKKGYVGRIRIDNILRTTDEQGISYDDGLWAQLQFGATDGTNRSGGIASGADWLKIFQRLEAVFTSGLYDISDAAITVNESSQPVLDVMMHSSTNIPDAITTQA